MKRKTAVTAFIVGFILWLWLITAAARAANIGDYTNARPALTGASGNELFLIIDDDPGLTSLKLTLTDLKTQAKIVDLDLIAAKGDLLAGTALDTVAVLTAGTNGQILSAQSAEATGLLWVADDDIPEAGDFAAATDLDLNGALVADAVGSAEIADGTVAAADIATDAVQLAELDDDANTPTAGQILIVETGANTIDYLNQNTFATSTHAAQHTTGGGDAVTVTSAMITDDEIVNADINTAAAIAVSKTALTAGTNITLATNTLNVDDAFLLNSTDDEAGGDIGFPDGKGPEMGADDDAKFYYDETDDIFILGSVDGASSNIENALYTVALDADNNEAEAANQELWEVGINGLGDPAGTWVEKASIDVEGDMAIAGSYNGGNVTSGADPGHTHTAASVSGVPDSGFLWIHAGEMIPRATNGPDFSTEEYPTNDIMFDQWLFNGANEEATQWDLDLPEEYGGGTITATYHWIAPTGSSAADGVVLGTSCRAWGNDDAADQAFGTEINVTDAVIAVGDVHISPTSAAITIAGTPTNAKFIKCQTARKVLDAGDDMTEDAKVIGVLVRW